MVISSTARYVDVRTAGPMPLSDKSGALWKTSSIAYGYEALAGHAVAENTRCEVQRSSGILPSAFVALALVAALS